VRVDDLDRVDRDEQERAAGAGGRVDQPAQ
jgi:hypothetical protein